MLSHAVGVAPRAKEVYEVLKERIRFLATGIPLPSMLELRDEFQVSQGVIEKAFVALEAQGLIERKPRKGVFVADRMATGEVAIVMTRRSLEPSVSPGYNATCSALASVFEEYASPYKVKLHLGNSVVSGDEFPGTLDILEPHVLLRLRGVFSFHPLYEVESKLEAAHVPVVYSCQFGHYGVYFNRKEMVRESVAHLVETGCRSICLLLPKYTGTYLGSSFVDVSAVFSQICSDQGVVHWNESIPYKEGGFTEQHGFDLFMQMWEKSDHPHATRPDGVLVLDEVLCAGVLRAIQRLGLSLPDDLRLITQTTKGLALPYHDPVTRVEYDVEAQARCVVEMMETLQRGDEPEQKKVVLKGVLVKGKTT